MKTFLGILIPFLGTTLGASCVFFMKKSLGDLVQRALAGFAAGVMVAASIWSLLIPAIEQSEDMGKLSFLPAFIGFWSGVLFLLLLDRLIPHLHVGSNQAEGPKSKLGRTTMMVLAVTLHNIPEGMAVGVVYAGFLSGNTQITAASALALSLGIAIQNFPEGAIISMPLRAEGERKGRALLGGVLSGVVEPIGAFLTQTKLPVEHAFFDGGQFAQIGKGTRRIMTPFLYFAIKSLYWSKGGTLKKILWCDDDSIKPYFIAAGENLTYTNLRRHILDSLEDKPFPSLPEELQKHLYFEFGSIEEHFKYRQAVMEAYPCGHYPVFEGYEHMQYQIRDPKGFAGMLTHIAERDCMPELPFIRK